MRGAERLFKHDIIKIKMKKAIFDHFSKTVDDYDTVCCRVVMKNEELHKTLVDAIPFDTEKEIRIMDLGCGTGHGGGQTQAHGHRTELDGSNGIIIHGAGAPCSPDHKRQNDANIEKDQGPAGDIVCCHRSLFSFPVSDAHLRVYSLKAAALKASPPPLPTKRSRSPSFTFPASRASVKAMGMQAEPV